jgi:HK97 family phage prohead protease
MTTKMARPPRDDLFRALYPSISVRATTTEPIEGEPAAPVVRTLFGHFLVTDQWAEISSMFEGNFMEMMAPGCARKTVKENREQIKCLYEHGYDFYIGNKPLGPFSVLEEDAVGVAYEVPLLDTRYCDELTPALEANLLGASVRFSVMREEWTDEPGVSDHNPKGLPERVIKEIRIYEGGPVTFGAYDGATAGVRSLCDEFLIERFARNPERTRALAEARAERVAARGGEPESEIEPFDAADVEADPLGGPSVAEVLEAATADAPKPTDLTDAEDEAPDTELPADDESSADDAPPEEDETGRRDDTPAEEPEDRSTPVAAPTYLGDDDDKPSWLLP